MAEIIEIIGPPAVGKTTIFNALKKRWIRNAPWAPKIEFLPKVDNSTFGTTSYWRYIIRTLMGARKVNQKKITNAAYSFLQRNKEFSSLCWELIHKNRTKDHLGVDNRFRSAFYVYQVMGVYQTIIDSPDTRICITDELLTHRIIQLTEDAVNKDDLREFVKVLPVPKGIIYLDAPVDILTKRSTERQRNIIRHQGRSSTELMQLASLDRTKLLFLCKELEQRDIPVLYINASQSIDGCVNEIIQHLRKLSKK